MAEKPFIAARLRNPAEEAAAKPVKAKSKTDWIGGVVAILAFIVAAVTTFLLWSEWAQLSKYLSDGLSA